MNYYKRIILGLIPFLLIIGCQSHQSACLPEDPHASLPIITPLPTTIMSNDMQTYNSPAFVEIRGKLISVDHVAHGSICTGTWSGVIYVDCDIQVPEWEEVPNFLDDCDLEIEEGTVVYVAAHNNQAYYKGCSCHYSDGKMPVSVELSQD